MRQKLTLHLVIGLMLLLMGPLIHNQSWANSIRIFTLTAEQWARPRSGEAIAGMEPLQLAVSYWEKGVDAMIRLSYPGGDSGILWASELKDWLISLGVPSDYIQLSPGLQIEDEVRILVGTREELLQ